MLPNAIFCLTCLGTIVPACMRTVRIRDLLLEAKAKDWPTNLPGPASWFVNPPLILMQTFSSLGVHRRLPFDDISLLTVVIFLVFMGIGTTGPTLSIYLKSLGADFSQISIILTTSSLVGLAGHRFWGVLSDRLGRRKPIVAIALAVMSLALLLISLAQSYSVVWGLQMLEALAMSAYSTVSLALIGDWLSKDQHQGRRLGTYRGFGSLAFATGAFVSGVIINRFGIPQAYIFGASVFALAGLCSLPVREAPHEDQYEAADADKGGVQWRDPVTLTFLLGVVLWNMAHSAQASMFPNFIVDLGLPEEASSWLWGLAALVEGLLMPVIGILSDSIGNGLLLISSGISLALVMAAYLVLRLPRVTPLFIGAQLARGWGYASFTVTSMLHVALLGSRKTRAGKIGIYGVAMSAGNIIGLAVGGQLVQWRSFSFLFASCSICYLTSSILFWIMNRKRNELGQAGLAVD